MMLSSRPTSSEATRVAPDFTLTDTAGQQVHLADLRGHNVVLYFNEGAGCGACLQQMTSIEQNKAAFDKANITVLPIVMNTREQITADMTQYGVKHCSCWTTAPSPAPTTPSGTACTPNYPATDSSSSTATASNNGKANTPPCGSHPTNCSTRSPNTCPPDLGRTRPGRHLGRSHRTVELNSNISWPARRPAWEGA